MLIIICCNFHFKNNFYYCLHQSSFVVSFFVDSITLQQQQRPGGRSVQGHLAAVHKGSG